MRRLLGIVLMLSVCWPLVSPVMAIAGGSDESLPACCRRDGAHHCMGKMMVAAASGYGTRVAAASARCPAYPVAVPAARGVDVLFRNGGAVFAEVVSHPAVRRQVEARARVALDRARQKRGPPDRLL